MEALGDLFRGLGGASPRNAAPEPEAMTRERSSVQPIDGLVVEVCSTFVTTDSEAPGFAALAMAQHKRSLLLGVQETHTTNTDTEATDRSSSLDEEHHQQGFLGRFFASKKVTSPKNKASLDSEDSSKDFKIQEIDIGAETRDDVDDSSIYDSSTDDDDDDSEISASSSQSHLYDASTIGGSCTHSFDRKRNRDHGSRSMSYCSEESVDSASMSDSSNDDDSYSSDEDDSVSRLRSPSSGSNSNKTFTFSVKDLMGLSTGNVEVRTSVDEEIRDQPEVMESISEDTPTPDDSHLEPKLKKRWLPWRKNRKGHRKFRFVSPKLDPIHESADDEEELSSMVDTMSINTTPSKRTRGRMEREVAMPRKRAKSLTLNSPTSPKDALGSGWEITSFKQKKAKFFKPFNRKKEQEFVITVRTATPTSAALKSP